MDKVKTVALVAHDNRKADLTEGVDYNDFNRSTADYLIDSPHFEIKYKRQLMDYNQYIERGIE